MVIAQLNAFENLLLVGRKGRDQNRLNIHHCESLLMFKHVARSNHKSYSSFNFTDSLLKKPRRLPNAHCLSYKVHLCPEVTYVSSFLLALVAETLPFRSYPFRVTIEPKFFASYLSLPRINVFPCIVRFW